MSSEPLSSEDVLELLVLALLVRRRLPLLRHLRTLLYGRNRTRSSCLSRLLETNAPHGGGWVWGGRGTGPRSRGLIVGGLSPVRPCRRSPPSGSRPPFPSAPLRTCAGAQLASPAVRGRPGRQRPVDNSGRVDGGGKDSNGGWAEGGGRGHGRRVAGGKRDGGEVAVCHLLGLHVGGVERDVGVGVLVDEVHARPALAGLCRRRALGRHDVPERTAEASFAGHTPLILSGPFEKRSPIGMGREEMGGEGGEEGRSATG